MLMIVQCSPAQYNVNETLSTLTFASRARQVELGKAKKNVRASEMPNGPGRRDSG